MLPHEAMSVSTGDERKRVADRIGITRSLLDKQCVAPRELGGDGRVGHIQRVLEQCFEMKLAGDPNWRFPVQYLSREIGCALVTSEESMARVTAAECGGRSIKEIGEFLVVLGETQTTGHTQSALERLVTEGFEAIAELFVHVRAAQRQIVQAEADTYRGRKGPKRSRPTITELREAAIA